MTDLIVILVAVTVVSLVAIVGILFVGLKEAFLGRILMALVGFASGSLIGGAFFHLLPEALEETGQGIWQHVVMGIVFFFIMEKFLYWRHCHDGKCPVHIFAYLNLIGDGMHNLADGMVIAASFLTSFTLGLATTLAVILHEIPQEIGDFGVLLYGGFERKRALTYNFMSALTAVAGSLITYYLASHIHGVEQFLVPFAAGGFIYIAATDLMPELHKRTQVKESLIQLVTILTGIGLMLTLKILLG
ncbi:MAG: zinc transporter ZupT [Candidatus Bathyarchaeota archaeon BA1]|nr:MAG: zinc transporter ZupT [Candidatus Bathyarchaeota archaeon BA1]